MSALILNRRSGAPAMAADVMKPAGKAMQSERFVQRCDQQPSLVILNLRPFGIRLENRGEDVITELHGDA